MAVALAAELIALLEPLARDNGLDLVTVEVAGGSRHQTVRVFLDREGGIDIEAITASNAWIEEALDGVARLKGPYTLEVSSPGIERVLRTREHFVRNTGSTVVIQTAGAVKSRLTGVLTGVDGDELLIESDGEAHRVQLADVERARVKADFGRTGEGKRRQQ